MNARLRVLAGAVALAGHTLPALALAAELRRRGHEVRFHGAERWREAAEGIGAEFVAEAGGHGAPGELAAAARRLAGSIRDQGSDVVVGDALTLSPLLAAEVAGVPRVRLLPEVYPVPPRGVPPFSAGLLPPRTALGRALWGGLERPLATRMPTTGWLRASHAALNHERASLGLAPAAGINEVPPGELVLVATLPELEYPRAWPEPVRVVGPLFFDGAVEAPEPPPVPAPTVLVAPSTVKDPAATLVATALTALADEPVGVLASTGGPVAPAGPVPANAFVTEWLDHAQAIERAAAVVCHGNHGTVTRALSAGVPLVVCPAMPDDAEHGARVVWAGAGTMVPARLFGERSLRAAVRTILGDPSYARRAGEIGGLAAGRDPAALAAELVEQHAAGR